MAALPKNLLHGPSFGRRSSQLSQPPFPLHTEPPNELPFCSTIYVDVSVCVCNTYIYMYLNVYICLCAFISSFAMDGKRQMMWHRCRGQSRWLQSQGQFDRGAWQFTIPSKLWRTWQDLKIQPNTKYHNWTHFAAQCYAITLPLSSVTVPFDRGGQAKS